MCAVHVVRQGECLSRIAWDYGFQRWQTVYDAPENESFRERRPNPNVIYPGDRIHIPDKNRRVEHGSTDKLHRFRGLRLAVLFRVVIQDEDGEPIGNAPFELRIRGEPVIRGKTDDGGKIEVEIPPTASEGVLKVIGMEWPVLLGHLDPVSRVSGVQQRLNNLGFDAGAIDGDVGPKTRRAIHRFQTADGDSDSADGSLNDHTRERLLLAHDADDRVRDAEEDMSETAVVSTESDDDDPCSAPLPGPGSQRTIKLLLAEDAHEEGDESGSPA